MLASCVTTSYDSDFANFNVIGREGSLSTFSVRPSGVERQFLWKTIPSDSIESPWGEKSQVNNQINSSITGESAVPKNRLHEATP